MPCIRFYYNGSLKTLTQFDVGQHVYACKSNGELIPVLFADFVGNTVLTYPLTATQFFIKISAVSASGVLGLIAFIGEIASNAYFGMIPNSSA
jgi:hypothetical protein